MHKVFKRWIPFHKVFPNDLVMFLKNGNSFQKVKAISEIMETASKIIGRYLQKIDTFQAREFVSKMDKYAVRKIDIGR